MKNNNFITVLFNGHRRVFFILFAFVLLAQIFVFTRQNALQALALIEKDFKIVISFNATEEKQQNLQDFLKKSDGIKNFKKLSSQDIFDIFSKGAKGQSNYVLNPAFVPALYELEVTEQVLLDTENWLTNNLYNFDEGIEVYYKTRQNQVAVYLKAFVKYISILALITVLALVSFGFFVEAYYTQIATAKERFGGILCGLIASGLAFAICKWLTADLALNIPLNQFDLKEQLIIVFLAMALGGTMSKWKRF